jgi:hypothetical protein
MGAGSQYVPQVRGRETAVSGSPGMEDRNATPITLGSTALDLKA